MLKNYRIICHKIYGFLIGVLGMEPIKAIRNRSVIEGDGIGAWSALKAEYETGSITKGNSSSRSTT